MEKSLKKGMVDKILVSGALSQLCLIAKDVDIGKTKEFLEKKDKMENESLIDLLPEIKKLIKKYPDKFELPEDLAIDFKGKRKEIDLVDLPSDYMILDIGKKTAVRFSQLIGKAKTIYMKGALGSYENPEFSFG